MRRFAAFILLCCGILFCVEIFGVGHIAMYYYLHNGDYTVHETIKRIDSQLDEIIKKKADYAAKIEEFDNQDSNIRSSELASACVLLQAYNYPQATIETFLKEGCVEYSSTDWTYSYYGDDSLQGWCDSPALEKFINNFLLKYNTETNVHKAASVKGNYSTLKEKYLLDNVPVIVWFTEDYKNPEWDQDNDKDPNNDNIYRHYNNQYCVCLYELEDVKDEESKVRFVDPYNGIQEMDEESFGIIYEACGCQSIVLEKG